MASKSRLLYFDNFIALNRFLESVVTLSPTPISASADSVEVLSENFLRLVEQGTFHALRVRENEAYSRTFILGTRFTGFEIANLLGAGKPVVKLWTSSGDTLLVAVDS